MVLLVTWYRIFFVDDNMELQKVITVNEVDNCIAFFTSMRLAYKTTQDEVFMFACNIDNDSRATEMHQYALKYDGHMTENEWSYVFKADINMKELSVTLQDRCDTSVLLKDEIVWSVFEYAHNCMLMSLNNTPDLLLVKDLKEVRLIKDNDMHN